MYKHHSHQKKSLFLKIFFLLSLSFFVGQNLFAQQPISYRIQELKTHGIEQFKQGHYHLAVATFDQFLKEYDQNLNLLLNEEANLDQQEAIYYWQLSNLKADTKNAIERAQNYIENSRNIVYQQRVAFALAQSFFKKNDLQEAIPYYEMAGIDNLSNEEIADAKFELAYCYFNNQQFSKAQPLFAVIKELPSHKYYVAGNYYYGLLAYNNQDYANALKSFKRIDEQETYKEIVPYYIAEIYYFTGDFDKLFKLSKSYLRKKGDLYYRKEMNLLTAQALFEQKKYQDALPYFEYYYENSDKIRKEVLYELAFSYYRLEDWNQAIEKFKPLSNAQDSLGQTSMYLLGDCYLKMNDKSGARNAFGICSDMNFNSSQQEAAYFLNAKLSYELGDESIATQRLNSFLTKFPNSKFQKEAQTLLSSLLSRTSNYAEAFAVLNQMSQKDGEAWRIYQQVAVGRALQLIQNNDLSEANNTLNLSLQQPFNPEFEAIAYFWKGDIAYLEKHYEQSIQYSQDFIAKAKGREASIHKISREATLQNAYMNIGYAYLELGNYAKAQSSFAAAQNNRISGYSDVLAADAILREADAQFMKEAYKPAMKLYNDALDAGIGNADYARYQIAMIHGILGNHDEKRKTLNKIAQKTNSKFKAEAQYELAVDEIENEKYSEAIPLLKDIVENQAYSDQIQSKAQFSLAYAYSQNNQLDKAAESYVKYIDNYPSAEDRVAALEALKSIYILQNRPEAYADFLAKNKMPGVDEESVENAFYDAASQNFGDSKWKAATEAFGKYISRFPNGKYATKAYFYRAESYMHLQEKDAALNDYEQVLKAGWSEYAESAALLASELAFAKEQYKRAFENYAELRGLAMNEQNLQTAYQGLMKTAFYQNNMQAAYQYADTLLQLPSLNKKTKVDALLYKGNALEVQEKYEDAQKVYEELALLKTGAASAEAQYRIANMAFKQKKWELAEDLAVKSARQANGQSYWEVKSYILLADVLKEQKDYFNAKATLQSVIKNAKEKDLVNEAKEKLKEVKNKEQENSKLENN